MNNYIQPGDVLTLVAPTGGVTAGVPVRIGDLFAIPVEAALVSVNFEGHVTGVFELVKDAGTAWAEGQPVYWDESASEVTHNPLLGSYLGYSVNVVASAAVLGHVSINRAAPVASQGVQTIRQRFTIAQVNAGIELLPAVVGRKYSMVDAIMIAVGGAVAAVTTVDILGTLSTAQKLVAAAQAGLTQSTVVRAGDSTGAVLADGASFIEMDANTAITVDITGSDITTATHVDVIFSYTLTV